MKSWNIPSGTVRDIIRETASAIRADILWYIRDEGLEVHMIVGKVVGSVVSTRKSEKLIGQKFMIVEPLHHMKDGLEQLIAIDIIGAGIGEYVLVAQGSAARIGCGEETAPIDAAIVGIIDDGAGLE